MFVFPENSYVQDPNFTLYLLPLSPPCGMKQEGGCHLQTRKRVLPRIEPFWHPDLRLLASITLRKQFLLFKPRSL